MIDNEQYMSAFELMNYIFVLVGDVDMDDFDGVIGMLVAQIYQLWLELLLILNSMSKAYAVIRRGIFKKLHGERKSGAGLREQGPLRRGV